MLAEHNHIAAPDGQLEVDTTHAHAYKTHTYTPVHMRASDKHFGRHMVSINIVGLTEGTLIQRAHVCTHRLTEACKQIDYADVPHTPAVLPRNDGQSESSDGRHRSASLHLCHSANPSLLSSVTSPPPLARRPPSETFILAPCVSRHSFLSPHAYFPRREPSLSSSLSCFYSTLFG